MKMLSGFDFSETKNFHSSILTNCFLALSIELEDSKGQKNHLIFRGLTRNLVKHTTRKRLDL